MIKKIVAAFFILLVVSIGAVLALLMLIDPNDYKQELQKLAAEQSVQLEIKGDIGWQFYPRVGLRSGEVKVGLPAEWMPQPARFTELELSVALLPLLKGELEVSRTLLSGGEVSLKNGNQIQQFSAITLDLSGANNAKRFFPLRLAAQLQQQDMAISLDLASQVAMDKTFEQIQIEKAVLELSLKGDFSQQQTLNIKQNFDLVFQRSQNQLDIKYWQLQWQQLKMEASGVVRAEEKTQQADLQISLQAKALNQLLTSLGQVPIVTSDAGVLQNLSLQQQVNFKSDDKQSLVQLNIQTLSLDETTLKGKANVMLPAQANKPPVLNLALQGDKINLDRYLPPADAEAEEKESKATKKDDEVKRGANEKLPFDQLKALPGQYQLAMQAVRLQNLDMNNIDILIDAGSDGLIQLKNISTDLYSGSAKISGAVDLRQTSPLITLKPTVSNISLGPLLQALQQSEQQEVSGDFSFNADIKTQGQTENALLENVNGSLSFESSKLVLHQVNLVESLGESFSVLLKQELPRLFTEAEQTVMQDIVGKANIKQGVIQNHLMQAKAPCTRFNGAGDISLPQQTLAYDMQIRFPAGDTNKACQEINPRLKDIDWPVHCEGAFDAEPSKLCQADKKKMEKILGKMLEKEAKRKLESKVQEKLKDELGEQAEELFKGFFR